MLDKVFPPLVRAFVPWSASAGTWNMDLIVE
jgi:hypothetical protein